MSTTQKIVQQMTDKETMIHVYEEHINTLEKENKSLKAQVDFLKEQLAYKTFGKPSTEDDKSLKQFNYNERSTNQSTSCTGSR